MQDALEPYVPRETIALVYLIILLVLIEGFFLFRLIHVNKFLIFFN